jgi:hypothetical protein
VAICHRINQFHSTTKGCNGKGGEGTGAGSRQQGQAATAAPEPKTRDIQKSLRNIMGGTIANQAPANLPPFSRRPPVGST